MANANIMQIKITLKGVKPPVWRRVLVPENMSLADLHDVVQNAMGWDNYHLYTFQHNGIEYQDQEQDDGGWDKPTEDAENTKLSRLRLRKGDKLTYTYDFGDDWRHTLLVEGILAQDKNQTYPVCIKGARACPPEDCGGIWGYEEMLERLKDKDSADYEELLEWLGEEFDSEHFDLDEVNRMLKREYA